MLPPAVRVQKSIEAEFSKRDQNISKLAEQLKRSQDAFEKNSATMSEIERRNRERELSDMNWDFLRM